MTDMVKCIFLVNAIQEHHPGGIERSKLETYIDFIEIDHSAIVEDDDAIVLTLSENLMLSFQFDEDSCDLITQATITIVVEDIDLHYNLYYPVIIQFYGLNKTYNYGRKRHGDGSHVLSNGEVK